MKQVQFSAGRASEWSSRFRQACKASAALCRGVTTGSETAGWSEEAELNGVEEERDGMSDEEGNEIDGEEELAAPDWRVRAGPRSKPTQREREEHEATHAPFRDWCAHCMMGRSHPSPCCKAEK